MKPEPTKMVKIKAVRTSKKSRKIATGLNTFLGRTKPTTNPVEENEKWERRFIFNLTDYLCKAI